MAFNASDLKKPDSAGRITLGKEYSGKTFAIRYERNGDIVLSPVVVIHEREAWLYQNEAVLKEVKEGLKDSAQGQVESLGSFVEFAGDDD